MKNQNMLNIRNYIKSDWKSVHEMLSDSMEYHLALPGLFRFKSSSKKLISDYLKSMVATINSGRGVLLIAEIKTEDKVDLVGFIYGEQLNHSHEVSKLIKKECIITEIFVENDFRNQGIATNLLHKIEDHFKRNGCEIIRLKDVNPKNKSAVQLYQKLGYKVRVVEYVLEIK